ncbi:MAG: lamin tail domain-containing protein [Thermotogae bacterium]|nr:lamin tail domain-containing protein [Thermotogota bacterium]
MFLLLVSVVINEVMYDPLGTESSAGLYNEAVELYNEDTLNEICLDGWSLSDRYDADEIIPFPDSAVLSSCPDCVLDVCIPPGGFGVILDRDYANPSSPDPMPYSFPSGTILMSVPDASLGNGLSQGDSLFLMNGTGDTADAVGGFPRTGDGRSAERKSPTLNRFLISRAPSGHTLGYGNSVSCSYEFTILPVTVERLSDGYALEFYVRNDGIRSATFAGRVFFNGEEDSTVILTLEPDSGRVLTFTYTDTPRGTNEVALISDSSDCDTLNNGAFLHFVVGSPTLVINEFNYKGIEWVELHNAGSWPLTVVGVTLEDGSSSSDSFNLNIPVGGYSVITSDSNFTHLFPGVPFLKLDRMPRLNDTYDHLILRERGEKLDSLRYSSSWGGNYNVSLERVSPYAPSDDPNNWGTCIDPSGGTPARENSLTTSPPSSGVSLKREILAVGDPLVLAFSLPFEAKRLRISLYDDLGRLVKREEFENLGRLGQVTVDTDGLWRGLYFVGVEASNGENRFVVRLRVALR